MLWRSLMLATAIVTLAGCDRKAEDAVDRYKALAASGATKAQLCKAAQETEVEWRLRKNESAAGLWQATRLADCIEASM